MSTDDRRDRGGCGVAGRARSASSLNEEFGDDQRRDELGGEHPLGLDQAAGHPPGQPRAGLGDVGVAQLGALGRVEDAGGLRADRGPALAASSPTSVAAQRRSGRAGPRRRRSARSVGRQARPRTRRRPARRARSNARRLLGGDRDRLVRRVVVLGRRRPRAAAAAGLLGPDLALERDRARARRCRAGRGRRPGVERRRAGRRRPRIAVMARMRIAGGDPEARGVAAREAGDGAGALGQHRSSRRGAVSGCRRRGPRDRPAARRLGDKAADDLAVGAAARPWGEPAHDLAQVAGRRWRRSRRSPRRRAPSSSASVRACGRYSPRMSISACSLAARSVAAGLRDRPRPTRGGS